MIARKPRPRRSQTASFPAPTAGWISNRALATPHGDDGNLKQGAAILDNFIPRATSVVMRGGSKRYMTLGDETETTLSLFSFRDGVVEKMFAATVDTIYDATAPIFPSSITIGDGEGNLLGDGLGNIFGWSSSAGLDVMTGLSGGDWSTVQFASTGNTYLIGVNGEGDSFIYDGNIFFPYVQGGVLALQYDLGTDDFTQGELVTGGTSGAVGTIWRIDTGVVGEGTLYLTTVTGDFVDNEAISGATSGAAFVNGLPVPAVPGPEFDFGVSIGNMSFVWVFKNRLWFVEKDTMNAWYMPIDAVGGEATMFPLAGIFSLGGSLLFGNRWSLSSGGDGGLSEQCAFVSSEGEVAIYQGTSPNEAATWSQVGVYRIGRPLGKNAFIRGAGDLAICTASGLVPLSKAIELDLTALTVSSISYPIADAWGEAVTVRGKSSWLAELWPEQRIAAIVPPSSGTGYPPVVFIANTETGAWSRFTGWQVTAMEAFRGNLYFGSTNGRVMVANEGGLDDGDPYTASLLPLFDDLGQPAARKIGKLGRYAVKSSVRVQSRVTWQSDFNETLPPAPEATEIEPAGNTWGTAVWGSSVWSERAPTLILEDWRSIGGIGYTGALAYQVTSGNERAIYNEIIRCDVVFDMLEIVN